MSRIAYPTRVAPSKPIKKGDTLLFVSAWNNKGQFIVTQFTVGSWGKVQAHLLHADGTRARRCYTTSGYEFFALASDVSDVREWAMSYGREWLSVERARLMNCLATPNASEGYRKAIQLDLDAVATEPMLVTVSNVKGCLSL